MHDKKRGTGRTTRMLQHAIKLDNEGRAVYIIAANHQQRMILFNMLRYLMRPLGDKKWSMMKMEIGNIKIETPQSPENFDWYTMWLRGANKNCVVLVDHWAIESHFGLMLKMLTAYDAPDAVSRS